MSRGPGVIQKAIVRHIRDNGTDTVESMRWSLDTKIKPKPIGPNDKLPTAWNTAFSRAIERLAAAPRFQIVIERRPLASMAECVRHYPGKTLLSPTRRLRLELLPALYDYVEKSNQFPRYNAAANEEYQIEQLSLRQQEALRVEWEKLAADLKPAYCARYDDRLLSLIVKGKSLFDEDSTLSDRRPFLELSATCCDAGLLSADLAGRVRKFAEMFIPPNTAGALRLKSFIHAFAFVRSTSGGYTLKDDTLRDLHRMKKEFVESLPGFEDSDHRRFRLKTQYSPLMNKLFDQTVFQEFQFISLAA